MRVGSLFSGIGGFDIAAERVGFDVAWQSEVDRYASRVLDYHYGDINRGDIHGIEDTDGADILVGGFPCQSYSIAGDRGGLADDRGALWWEFHRLIERDRPEWVVGENVTGLLSSAGGRDFATIIRSLVQCGYGVCWRVLDAQYFGVPQRRRRVFIVAHSGGQPRPEVLALSEGLSGYPQPSRKEGKAVAALTRNGLGGGGADDNLAQAGHIQTWTQQRTDQYAELDVASTLAQRDYKGATDLVAWAQNSRDEVRYIGGDGQVAGALAAAPGMKQQTYVGVRRLTPLECERLQGFPDGWTGIEGNSDTQRYRQLGNAVAVPVVEWIMERIAWYAD